MRLTQIFVRRPTLVVVACALIVLAGALALVTLVQQNFPNIDFPTVQVRLSYPGASPTEIRDAIVKPVEDAIAGAPNLDHINTSIQQGQATIAATFTLNSNQTTDLVEVGRRVESTEAVLPTDLSPPTIGTFDPGQATVVTLALTSSSMTRPALSALITNDIVPEMEQIDGVSNVNANGVVTPAIEVMPNPNLLNASGFVLGDLVQAISNNNIRAPGGLVYGPDRETSVDVRGDLTSAADVANLPLYQAAAGTTGQATLLGPEGGTSLQTARSIAGGTTAATSFAVAGSSAVGAIAVPPSGTSTATTVAAGSSVLSPSLPAASVAPTAAPVAGATAAPAAAATAAPIVTAAPATLATPAAAVTPLNVTATPVATASAATSVSSSAGTSSAGTGTTSSATTSSASNGPSVTGSGVSAGLNPWSVSSRIVRIRDVAQVVSSFETPRVYAYVGDQLAISLGVQKATGASEIVAADNVVAALPRLRAEYPAVNFAVLNDQAQFTQQQLDSVYRTLVEAIVFTGVVMLFFLRSWRNAIVVIVAIPTSLLVTLAVMRVMNFTIDTISLLAMTLVVGILVDDSIVVLENTERHYEDGEAPQTAAILARGEMGAAALVITLVDVVVFLPISFLPGTIGRFFSEFGLVVVVATLTSLAVSFTITPSLAGNWSLLSRWRPPAIINWFTRGFEAVRRFYVARILDWALHHPRIVVSISALLTIGAVALVPLGYVGFEFMPPVDRGQIFLQLSFPTGTPLTTTNAAIATLTKRIVHVPDVDRLTGTAGSFQAGFGGGVTQGSSGQITIFLKDQRAHPTEYWARIFGAEARRLYPLANPVAIPATGFTGGNSQPIDYLVESADDNPAPYAVKILKVLSSTPGIAHANSSALSLLPQVDVIFDRERARALDADVATAANAIRSAFGGSLAAQFFTTRGVEYVQVIWPQTAMTSVREIAGIPFRTRSGNIVYVGDVAHLAEDPNSPLLTRVNRQTVIHLSANMTPGAAQSIVQQAFMRRLAALHLPLTVRVVPNVGGQQQNLSQTVHGLGATLLLSFVLVYLLMLALYDSYRLPFIIMFAIPVAAVGAIGSLAITGQALNLYSLIGTVLLVGLVSKNGILLVDFANHRIRAGIDRYTAIREAARERFRPIVMTTFSMIAGMTPIALALDPGASVRQALGVVVIGGLTSSLLLTLVLVPVAFVWFAPRHPLTPEKAGAAPQPAAPAAPSAAHA